MEEGDMMLDAFCLERSLPIPNLTLLAWCEVSRNNIRVGGALSRLFSCILTTNGARYIFRKTKIATFPPLQCTNTF